MKDKRRIAIFYAFSASVFYGVNTPLSKLLLAFVPATFMASFLYLGAGVGVGILYAFHRRNEKSTERLVKADMPYTVGMVALDIAAPIFLMLGLKYGNASNASLLGNFEIVTTTVIARIVFREKVSPKLWRAIALITVAGILLTFNGTDGFVFSLGSLFVILATLCWGLENNCTRKISEKSTYQIVTVKGLGSGLGSFLLALLIGEPFPEIQYVFLAMLLGFVSYGLSIFTYIRAQRDLGAAKTSAYYAIAPFIGAGFSFLLLKYSLTWSFAVALIVMVFGTATVISDTLKPTAEQKNK